MSNKIEETFEKIHETWKWLIKDPEHETTCWKWSKVINNINLINNFPKIIEKYWIKNIIDLWCWDINWIRFLFNYFIENKVTYTGLDVSKTIINKAKEKIEQESKYINLQVWLITDIKNERIPNSLILSKDVLVHLPNEIILETLEKVKKRTDLLLTTNFPISWTNKNIELWEWRPINLIEKPFNLSIIEEIIPNTDKSTKNIFPDKNITLFRI